MGLIKAALGAAGGVMADQWKEFFYCEAIPSDVLVVKGQKKVTGRSSNKRGDNNIITNGSLIAVADGQCMLIVEQGKVVDVCAEPGEYTYDMSTEPSIFSGDLGDSVRRVFENIGKRFTFGGEAPKDQRIYYFNTKELTGNKYGTPSPVPFRVVDQRAGIDLDIGIRCFGEYSIRLKNPVLFYTNVCGNVSEDYKTETIDGTDENRAADRAPACVCKDQRNGDPLFRPSRPHVGVGRRAQRAAFRQVARPARHGDRLLRRFQREGQRGRRADDQGLAAQRGLHGSHPCSGASCRRSGRCDEGGGRQHRRRPGYGLHGHGNGRTGGRHERPESLARWVSSNRCSSRRRSLPRLRQCRAGRVPCGQSGITGNFCPNCGSKKPEPKPAAASWKCCLRCNCYRKILPRMRQSQARSCGRGLDVRLRRGKQGEVLLRMRREETRRGSPVQV